MSSYQLSSKAVNLERKVVLRTNEDFTRIGYILIYQQSKTIHLKLPKSSLLLKIDYYAYKLVDMKFLLVKRNSSRAITFVQIAF